MAVTKCCPVIVMGRMCRACFAVQLQSSASKVAMVQCAAQCCMHLSLCLMVIMISEEQGRTAAVACAACICALQTAPIDKHPTGMAAFAAGPLV